MSLFRNITVERLHCSATDNRYLVVSGDNYFETNGLTAELLSALAASESREEGIDRFLDSHDGYSREQIDGIIDNTLLPRLEQGNKAVAKPFLYQRPLLGARHIDALTDRLAALFNPWAMTAMAVAGIAAVTCFFAMTERVLTFGNRVDAWTLMGLMAFVFCSSMFHELGHAAAAKRFGIRHGGIGFGLYLNFPVLYTDVTAAWRLPRRQRCVVNIGGVYFQTIILIGLVVAFLLTGSDVLRYMVLMILLGFVLTLNPFFKFDGYWMATDLLGVHNLRQQTQRLLGYYLRRLVDRHAEKPALLSALSGKIKAAVAVYAVTVNIFMCYYFLYIIPMFLYGFVNQFPNEFMRLITCLSNNIMPPMALLRNLGSQLLFLGLIGYMLYRLAAPYYYRYVTARRGK